MSAGWDIKYIDTLFIRHKGTKAQRLYPIDALGVIMPDRTNPTPNTPKVRSHDLAYPVAKHPIGLGRKVANTPPNLIVRSTISKRRQPRQPGTTSDLLRVIPSTCFPCPLLREEPTSCLRNKDTAVSAPPNEPLIESDDLKFNFEIAHAHRSSSTQYDFRKSIC